MADQLPQKFGNYTLHRLIARGGMAEIYRATMPGIGGFEKTVAIKKILPHLAENEEFITMLKDEANILVSINDSNIAQVYDLGRIDDTYFIAMEYVHGLDLSHVLKGLKKLNMQLPIEHALYIGSCMCAGLHAAHTNTDRQGNPLQIVHRDVSPHNVIISYAGDVKLIDFGVAKAAVKESHTQMGVIKGKLLYMAPEQAMAKALDGRADLFAVGLCMYKMLTDELPFSGENEFQIYNNILSKEIVPPNQLNPSIPQEVNQVVMTLLQRDPDKRYQDGYTAKQDLRRALHNMAPGYTVNRLGRFIEDHFSEAAMRQQQSRKDTSGPSTISPQTPSATSLGTGELRPGTPSFDSELDTADTVEGERLQIPALPHGPLAQPSLTPPLTPALRPQPGPAAALPAAHTSAAPNFRTQNYSEESTGKFAVDNLNAPAQVAPRAGGRPVALYVVGGLGVAIVALLAAAMFSNSKPSGAENPADTQPAQVEPTRPSAATPLTVQIALDSQPSGARVYRGSDLLGETPHTLMLRRSSEPLDLSLQLAGFSDRAFRIIPDTDDELVITLQPIEGYVAPEQDEPLAPQPADQPAATPEPAAPGQKAAARPATDVARPPSTPPAEPARPRATDTRTEKPAAAPKKQDEPAPKTKPTVAPLGDFDLWGDDAPAPKKAEPKKSPEKPAKPASEPKKPAEKPAKTEPEPKKPAEKEEKPREILNPFG